MLLLLWRVVVGVATLPARVSASVARRKTRRGAGLLGTRVGSILGRAQAPTERQRGTARFDARWAFQPAPGGSPTRTTELRRKTAGSSKRGALRRPFLGAPQLNQSHPPALRPSPFASRRPVVRDATTHSSNRPLSKLSLRTEDTGSFAEFLRLNFDD